ncbi:MAG: DUF6056 family protein [Bacteroidota bacterium]|nr:DUF6056 family protein [Bacteroidota bacterium]
MLDLKKNIYLYTALFLLISFGICHFTFSYFNTLESDDYNLIAYIKEKGFFGTIWFIYMEWEGAFGVLLISLLKIKFTLLTGSLFLHNVLSCIITLYCFYYFIKACFVRLHILQKDHFPIILAILIYTNIYYNNLALNDTWYWLCGSIYFFMPAVLLFFIGVILNQTNKYLVYIAYAFFFIFGASRFNYSVITLSVLCLLLFYFWIKNKTINKTMLLLLTLVLAALVIYVIAPGNYIRRNDELKSILTLSDYVIGPLKMASSFIYKYIILKAPYHALFLLPALFIGFSIKDRIQILIPTKQKLFSIGLYLVGFLLFCIYVQCFSMFLAKGSQVNRTLEMLCIICSFIFMVFFLMIGAFLHLKKLYLPLGITCMLVSSLLLLRRIHICYPIIKKYSIAVDERHRTIENAMKNFTGDTLVLKKLPPASWLHCGELKKRAGTDPMNNIFLENYYKPKFALDIED